MSIYLSSPWVSQSFLGCGPSFLPSTMDLYEEALYAQAVRERQRRVAMQREIELRKQRQIEAMMQRMAIESAVRDYAEREYQRAQRQAAWERKRAERERKAKATNDGHVYLQLGDVLFRLMPQASDEDSDETCDNLASLTSDVTKEPVEAKVPTSIIIRATSSTEPAEPKAEQDVKETTEELAHKPEAAPEPKQAPKVTAPEPEAAPEPKQASKVTAPEPEAAPEPKQASEATALEPQERVLFTYDFPDAATAYGRDVRKHVKSDNLHVEANTLNGGSIKISGLWRKTAPSPSSRASSPRSPHVRDVDEDGNEILLAEDTDSDSDTEQGVSFTESAVIPLPSLDELRNMRAELDDSGFKLWTTV